MKNPGKVPTPEKALLFLFVRSSFVFTLLLLCNEILSVSICLACCVTDPSFLQSMAQLDFLALEERNHVEGARLWEFPKKAFGTKVTFALCHNHQLYPFDSASAH